MSQVPPATASASSALRSSLFYFTACCCCCNFGSCLQHIRLRMCVCVCVACHFCGCQAIVKFLAHDLNEHSIRKRLTLDRSPHLHQIKRFSVSLCNELFLLFFFSFFHLIFISLPSPLNLNSINSLLRALVQSIAPRHWLLGSRRCRDIFEQC